MALDLFEKLPAVADADTRIQDYQKRIVAAGITVFPAGADEFGAYIAREHVKWAKAVKDSGATLD